MISADTSQLNNLAVDLGRTGVKVTVSAGAVVRETLDDLEATMKELAPVKTGALRDSISTTRRGLSGEVGPTADHSRYLEFGTAHMPPQPFVGPAADRHEPQFVRAMTRIADIKL